MSPDDQDGSNCGGGGGGGSGGGGDQPTSGCISPLTRSSTRPPSAGGNNAELICPYSDSAIGGSNATTGPSTTDGEESSSTPDDLLADHMSSASSGMSSYVGVSGGEFNDMPFQMLDWSDAEILLEPASPPAAVDDDPEWYRRCDGRRFDGNPLSGEPAPSSSSSLRAAYASESTRGAGGHHRYDDGDPCLSGLGYFDVPENMDFSELLEVILPNGDATTGRRSTATTKPSDHLLSSAAGSQDVLEDLFEMEDRHNLYAQLDMSLSIDKALEAAASKV